MLAKLQIWPTWNSVAINGTARLITYFLWWQWCHGSRGLGTVPAGPSRCCVANHGSPDLHHHPVVSSQPQPSHIGPPRVAPSLLQSAHWRLSPQPVTPPPRLWGHTQSQTVPLGFNSQLGNKLSLKKQRSAVTPHTILQQTEETWQILNKRTLYDDKCLFHERYAVLTGICHNWIWNLIRSASFHCNLLFTHLIRAIDGVVK